MTDLEKMKEAFACCGLGFETKINEYGIELAIYDFDKYLGSIYFNRDGLYIASDC